MTAVEQPVQQVWFSPKQAATRTGKGERRIREALHEWVRTGGKSGLRGSQPGQNCCWHIHVDDIDAWISGEKPPSTRGRHLGRAS